MVEDVMGEVEEAEWWVRAERHCNEIPLEDVPGSL